MKKVNLVLANQVCLMETIHGSCRICLVLLFALQEIWSVTYLWILSLQLGSENHQRTLNSLAIIRRELNSYEL